MRMDYDKHILYVTQEEYQTILNFAVATSATSERALSPILKRQAVRTVAPYGISVVVDEEKAKRENYYP